jgi:hypothetical protein
MNFEKVKFLMIILFLSYLNCEKVNSKNFFSVAEFDRAKRSLKQNVFESKNISSEIQFTKDGNLLEFTSKFVSKSENLTSELSSLKYFSSC